MSNEIEKYEEPETTVTTTGPDPTGGRLVAWAHAAGAAKRLADALVHTSFVPLVGPKNNRRKLDAGDAAAMILAGDEVGFTPVQALRSIYLVHGTPALNAKAMAALVMSKGHDFWVEEEGPAKVTVGGRRRGSDHEQRVTWTLDRARKAGYTRNEKYQTHPQEMLYARAVSELCRRLAPDALAGMGYSVEELEQEQEPTTTTVTRSSATQKVRRTKPEPEEPPLDETPQQESPDVRASVEGADAGTSDTPPAVDEPELDDAPQGGASSGEDIQDAEVVDEQPITDNTRKHMFALLNQLGITDAAQQRAGMSKILGRKVTTRSGLTQDEGQLIIDDLRSRLPEDLENEPDPNFPPEEG